MPLNPRVIKCMMSPTETSSYQRMAKSGSKKRIPVPRNPFLLTIIVGSTSTKPRNNEEPRKRVVGGWAGVGEKYTNDKTLMNLSSVGSI